MFTSDEDFDEYINNMIGSYRYKLEKMTFTDRRQTRYLAAVKYNADLVWNQYNINQDVHPELALVNTEVLNNTLLSLHPSGLLKDKDISNSSREALRD